MSFSTHYTCGVLCTHFVCLAGCARLPQTFQWLLLQNLEVMIKIRGKKQHARLINHNIINFLVILARTVSILGLSTEWCDRIFQSIIVRGKNENL